MPRYDDDEDDRPRRSRRRRDDDDRDDYDDEYPRRRRPPPPQVSILGVISLVKGIGALILSFVPCIGAIAVLPGILGLFLGLLGFYQAKQSRGRTATGLPIAGASVSGAAILIALAWMGVGAVMSNRTTKVMKEIEAEEAAMRAERQAEMAKAAAEVKAADPGMVVKVTAVDLDRAFAEDDEAADARYEGKILELIGKVESIDLDEDEDVYTLELTGFGRGSTVTCEFAKTPAAKAELTALRKGTLVTIRGKCVWPTLEGCGVVK